MPKRKCEERIRDLNLSDNIKFLGHLSREELRQLYQKSDVLALRRHVKICPIFY